MAKKQTKSNKNAKKIVKTEIVSPVPQEKEYNWKGIAAVVIMLIVISGGAFYFFSQKRGTQLDDDYKNSITVNNIIFPFRHSIDNFSKVETFPNDLHIAYSVHRELDYYKIIWDSKCEESQTCGLIALAGIDVSRSIRYNYQWQTANTDIASVNNNNSITVFFKPELILENDLSIYEGLEIILRAPGETNQTRVSYYEVGDNNRIIIEGATEDDFLRAIDKFSYLVLRFVQSE